MPHERFGIGSKIPAPAIEKSGAAYFEEPKDPGLLFNDLLQVLDLKSQAEYEPEPVMRVGYQSIRDSLDENTEFKALVNSMLAYRPTITPIYAAHKLIRNVQLIARKLAPDFPDGWDDPSRWKSIINKIANPDANEMLYTQFLISNNREIISNKADRAKAVLLASEFFGLEGPQTVIEFGGSLMHVLKRLATYRVPGFHFSSIDLVKTRRERQDEGHRLDIHKKWLGSLALNRVLQKSSFELSYGVSLDIFSPYDPAVKEQALNDSFYSDEFKNKQATDKFRYLTEEVNPPHIKAVYPVDISLPIKLNRQSFTEKAPDAPEKFDIALFSFSLYELKSQRERDRAIANAKELSNRLIVVLDAVNISPDGNMIFRDNRAPFRTTVTVYDMANEAAGWQRICYVDNGRFSQTELTPLTKNLPIKDKLNFISSRLLFGSIDS